MEQNTFLLELSQDLSTDYEYIKHALEYFKKKKLYT